MALQFLLTDRNSIWQDAIVESGGISLLVDALSTERDDEVSRMLLELLHSIAASSTSHVQEIDLVVQSIVDSNKPSEFDHTNLLLLVYHEQGSFEPSEIAGADQQKPLKLFILHASVNILLFPGSGPLHKYIALNCLHETLPDIGFVFVFDYSGIPLLWDIVMVNVHEELTYVAIEILRWLARENKALRDHIFDFYTQYSSVEEKETKIKAASIRHQIFGGRNKRKRSAIDSSLERQSDFATTGGGLDATLTGPSALSETPCYSKKLVETPTMRATNSCTALMSWGIWSVTKVTHPKNTKAEAHRPSDLTKIVSVAHTELLEPTGIE